MLTVLPSWQPLTYHMFHIEDRQPQAIGQHGEPLPENASGHRITGAVLLQRLQLAHQPASYRTPQITSHASADVSLIFHAVASGGIFGLPAEGGCKRHPPPRGKTTLLQFPAGIS